MLTAVIKLKEKALNLLNISKNSYINEAIIPTNIQVTTIHNLPILTYKGNSYINHKINKCSKTDLELVFSKHNISSKSYNYANKVAGLAYLIKTHMVEGYFDSSTCIFTFIVMTRKKHPVEKYPSDEDDLQRFLKIIKVDGANTANSLYAIQFKNVNEFKATFNKINQPIFEGQTTSIGVFNVSVKNTIERLYKNNQIIDITYSQDMGCLIDYLSLKEYINEPDLIIWLRSLMLNLDIEVSKEVSETGLLLYTDTIEKKQRTILYDKYVLDVDKEGQFRIEFLDKIEGKMNQDE
jgi:hypothetical protein